MNRKAYLPSKPRFKNNLCYLEIYNNLKEVIGEAIIDREDYDKVRNFRLHLSKSDKNKPYVKVKTNKNVYLQHVIIGKAKKGFMIDHKNRFTLDNRKCNLRVVTASNNQMNRGKTLNKTSIYKGVHYDKNRSKWKAEIKLNQKNIYIGRFDNEVDGAIAYNEKANELFGEYAKLNNIIKGEQHV